MNRADSDLGLAFDVASGLEGTSAGEVAPDLLAFARGVVASGRRLARQPRCPAECLRRARGLIEGRREPRTLLSRIARIALRWDSWCLAAPATRGARRTRLISYTGPEGRVDLEFFACAEGGIRVRGLVGRPSEADEVALCFEGFDEIRVPLAEPRTFGVDLPDRPSTLVLAVYSRGRPVFRIPAIAPLEERG